MSPFGAGIGSGDHPRIRGEHRQRAHARLRREGSSPHTRGAPRCSPAFCVPRMDHPRIRGEHCTPLSGINNAQGSSPHTRGAPALDCDVSGCHEIIPAYAGSTRGVKQYASKKADHPRIRGEHSLVHTDGILKPGSSPHTRGARRRARCRVVALRIIPAYAGSTGISRISFSRPGDHPRIRGEHTYGAKKIALRRGSSPHTRGAPTSRSRSTPTNRIIPAYAGSTRLPGSPHDAKPDHPRIRGEHRSAPSTCRKAAGSSPHTRGALSILNNLIY